MKSEEDIIKLARGYFLEKKAKEIGYTLIVLLFVLIVFVVIPLTLGMVIGDNRSSFCNGDIKLHKIPIEDSIKECTLADAWGEGLLYILFSMMPVYLIYVWIKSNWKSAVRKARGKCPGCGYGFYTPYRCKKCRKTFCCACTTNLVCNKCRRRGRK